MEYLIGFVIGAAFGAGLALVISHMRTRQSLVQMRETFAALAGEALDNNSRRLGDQTGSLLESKKELIDQSVKAINERLNKMGEYFQHLEADRKKEFGQLSNSVTLLSNTTGQLHQMLASTQRRGAWGERMAEDIITLAGMAEGVNYSKQSSDQAASGRPDFTFYLPNDLKVNMDVKFPLESYKAYLDAETDEGRQTQVQSLVTAVKGHVRAVASRGYIDPKIPTVNYVVVFLPSEQILSLVLAANGDMVDEALSKRVVLASPMTLYAMLSVIRQAAESANLMRTADEVLDLLHGFLGQWNKYSGEFDKLEKYLSQTTQQFEKIRSTRTRQLERQLEKIETLRTTRGLADE